MSENDLRSWLKKVWGSGLIWHEPARGGSVGVPDVELPMSFGLLPIELKFWERTVKGLRCEVRPSQRRYHRLAALAGRRTAFLVLSSHPKNNQFEVSAFPGFAVPMIPYPSPPILMTHINFEKASKVFSREQIVMILESKFFWEGI